jgi:hypothetical protein
VAEDGLQRLELNLHPNEASGLLTVEDEVLLEAHGWELAFWAVLDEGEIEDCVAVIGHRRGADISEGWEIERLHAEPQGDAGRTEDAEAVTRRAWRASRSPTEDEGVHLRLTRHWLLERRGVLEDLVGVRLGGDLRVDLGDLAFGVEQEGDAVRPLPVLAQHPQRLRRAAALVG